jgi:hypothetical protein
MSIDERLERLAERQEALTQSVEILHRDVQALRLTAEALVASSRQDGENIRALARIAEIREQRLSDLEGE